MINKKPETKKEWDTFFADCEKTDIEALKGTVAPDMVNSPPHYNCGEIETIDYIVDVLGTRGAADYCHGNVLKYLGSRLHRKNDPVENSKKAQWYLDKMI
jgi:hypothetical protein